MKFKSLLTKLTFLAFVFAPCSLQAQLGINGDNSVPSSDAMLDVKSTNKGILIPRLGSDVASPTEGLFYYNTIGHKFKYFDGTAWQQAFFGNQWNVNVNAITYSVGNVGIGISSPNSKAALDITSTTQGFLPPRMDSTQRNAIAAPPAGLVIYNTSIKAFQCYNGTVWYSTVHFIGEKYAGGTVFFVYDNGQHGLIASYSDQNTGISWNNNTARITGTNGDGLNAGVMNTTLQVAIQMADNIFGNFAAKVCADYSVLFGGITYGDWYLPSKYELNLLYLQKNIVGGFSSNAYWSSTDYNGGNAYVQYFGDGNQIPQPTAFPFYVRAIRAF